MNVFDFIVGKELLIDWDYGLSQLNEIIFNQSLGFDKTDFEQQKQRLSTIDFYNNGAYIGSDITDIKKNSIAKIQQSGAMILQDGWCRDGLMSFDRQMRQLYANPNVEGILVSQDTGGGEAEAGGLMNSTIGDRNKPVIIHTHRQYSGGVLGALQADENIAVSEMTGIGSIGVMTSFPTEMLKEYKEKYTAVYSDKSENKNRDFRDMLNDDFSTLKAQLTRADEIFMNLVKTNRTLKGDRKTINHTLSGATFPAVEAKKRGLIHGIGSENYAMSRFNRHFKYYK